MNRPRLITKTVLSILVCCQIIIVAASLVAHRGASAVSVALFEVTDPYRTFFNWRMESNVMSLASDREHLQTIELQWRGINAATLESEIDWEPIAFPAAGNLDRLRQNRWLQQMTDLEQVGILEGVSEMVLAAVQNPQNVRTLADGDEVRLLVSPTFAPEQFLESMEDAGEGKVPEFLQPEIVYEAKLFQIDENRWSLLPKNEARRQSRSVRSARTSN